MPVLYSPRTVLLAGLTWIFFCEAALAQEVPTQAGSQPSAEATGATTQAPGDPQAGKVKSTTCTGCHAIPGYVNVYPTYHVPKVAGQHYEYLVAALNAYRAGERDHPTMRAQGLSLSDQDIADIAAYFSSLLPEPEPGQTALAGENAQAEKLCASCHGKGGISTNPIYPHLAGQYQDYLLQALKDYQSGARENAIMQGLVGTLSAQDLNNLAAYYADQEYLKTLETAEE